MKPEETYKPKCAWSQGSTDERGKQDYPEYCKGLKCTGYRKGCEKIGIYIPVPNAANICYEETNKEVSETTTKEGKLENKINRGL